MGMIEKAEQDYLDLKKKREIILEDRASIMKTIEQLDTRKKKALEIAYSKVGWQHRSIIAPHALLLQYTGACRVCACGSGLA